MLNEKTYWFITVFTRFDDKYGIKGARTWGFYSNKKDAINVLEHNTTDLWEYCYDYAVLEAYQEGISGYDFEEGRQFFKYNQFKKGYFPLAKEPEEVKHYASFAIG